MPNVNPNRNYWELGQGGNPVPQRPRTLEQTAPQPQPGFSQQPQGVDAFSTAIADLLKRYQSLGTRPFKEQELGARDAQADRVLAQTPQSLIGSSAGVQNSARNASVNALDPTVRGAQASQQTFSEQIRTLGDAIESTRQFSRDYEAKQQAAKSEARQNLLLAVQLGGAAGLDAIKKENPNIFKIAGLDEETLITAAKSKELYDQESKKTFSTVDLGDRVGVFDQKGNLIKTIPKGVPPKAPKGGFTTTVSGRPFVARDELTTAEQKLVDQISAAEKLVNQVEGLYKSAVGEEYSGSGSGVAARLKGITRGLGRAAGTNEASKQYKSFVESNLSIIARGLKGEVGVLTNQDITRARGALPTGFSSPAEADTAFRTLRQQMKDNISVYGQFADEDPNVWEKIPDQ